MSEPMKPVTITRDDATDTVTIEGVRYSGAFFRVLAFAVPDDKELYIFQKDGQTVRLVRIGSLAQWENGQEALLWMQRQGLINI